MTEITARIAAAERRLLWGIAARAVAGAAGFGLVGTLCYSASRHVPVSWLRGLLAAGVWLAMTAAWSAVFWGGWLAWDRWRR